MDDYSCGVRLNRERMRSFVLGYNFDEEEGLHPEYYCLGEEFSGIIEGLNVISFGVRNEDIYLHRFVKGFEKLNCLRDKYADCLPSENLDVIDGEISRFRKVASRDLIKDDSVLVYGRFK